MEKVQISILGKQYMDGQNDKSRTDAQGLYEKKNMLHKVTYDEYSEEGAIIHNTLGISDKAIQIKKEGAMEGVLLFKNGARGKIEYQTPYGRLSMENHCQNITVKEFEEGVTALLKYDLCTGGDVLSHCETEIEIRKEK